MYNRDQPQDVNKYWEYVKARYPYAMFVHWFDDGELHFYRNKNDEKLEKDLCLCYRDDRAKLTISVGDNWK